MKIHLSLLLRPLTLEDAGTIAGWAADPIFCRAAGWTVGLPPGEHLAFQTRLIAQPPTDLVRLGVSLDGRLVGYVVFQGTEAGRRELGFVIGERGLWGQGLGLAAAWAGLRCGFATMGLSHLWAEALDADAASVRILKRLGMQETGPGSQGTYLGRPSHYRQFAITPDELVTGQGHRQAAGEETSTPTRPWPQSPHGRWRPSVPSRSADRKAPPPQATTSQPRV